MSVIMGLMEQVFFRVFVIECDCMVLLMLNLVNILNMVNKVLSQVQFVFRLFLMQYMGLLMWSLCLLVFLNLIVSKVLLYFVVIFISVIYYIQNRVLGLFDVIVVVILIILLVLMVVDIVVIKVLKGDMLLFLVDLCFLNRSENVQGILWRLIILSLSVR